MRVGIWCDYGFTLEPTEGIGVFVANLAKGIVDASDETEVLLVPHPGKADVLRPIVEAGKRRIRIAPRRTCSWLKKKAARRGSKSLDRITHWMHQARLPAPQLLTNAQVKLATPARPEEIAEFEESCDLWLVPYVGTDQIFNKPTVVAVHDLVAFHFQDTVRPHQLLRLRSMVATQVEQASRLACMSEFIRQHDLVETLGVKREETDVVQPAVPSFGTIRNPQKSDLSSLGIERPFVFYPAAFRTYKNHRLLIETLQHLKRTELWPISLVFTGIRSCPRWLQSHIRECSAEADVVCLGKVATDVLSRLYRSAYATVVPSLYEQGSFPIMEAIHHGCPAVCSDIPPLREQFGGMGNAMIYFDPHNPVELASKLVSMKPVRSKIIKDQQAAFRNFASRTWGDAARDWLEVFERAIEGTSTIPSRIKSKAA